MLFSRRGILGGGGAALLSATGLYAIGGTSWAQAVSDEALAVPGPLGDRVLGSADAPVTIYEYASMTCPHCATFHNETYATLKSDYIDTGKVRLVFREFPLDAAAFAVAMLARCAPADQFFPFITTFFEKQDEWARASDRLKAILALAEPYGFTEASLEQCLKNQNLFDGLNWVRDRASKTLGVRATPTFFINGEKEEGALSIAALRESIDPKL